MALVIDAWRVSMLRSHEYSLWSAIAELPRVSRGLRGVLPGDMVYFEQASASFILWLEQQGTTVTNKIELVDLRLRGAGRGVVATQNIGEDDKLFSVPRSAMLTIQNSKLPDDIKAQLKDPWLGLIVAMIYEDQQGADSQWKAYFDVLPTTFDTLMFWSDEELQWLHGSAVANKIGRDSADAAFKDRVLPLIRAHPGVFKLSDSSDDNIVQICHRMGSIIMAYAFDIETPESENEQKEGEDGWEEDDMENQQKGMIPLADILNADADRCNAKLYYEDDKVTMKAIQPIAAGDEIFNDYGPLPTADVLRRYGYTTANYAQYDVVEISLEDIKLAAKHVTKFDEVELEARLQYLESQDSVDTAYDIARPSQEDVQQFPDELCIVVNILTLPQTEFEQMKKREKMLKPTLSIGGTKVLSQVMVARLQQYLQSGQIIHHTYDEPDVMDGGEQNPRRKAMALQVIGGEVEVLRLAMSVLDASVDNLVDGAGPKRKAANDEASSPTIKRNKQ
ncbi:hypothetical protein LTR62_001585 [Meristemomyces frigidus]|uniref:SET domain-containing protein n=1 Tax=Meristemomyces frigidus TaxID=1508187 RepID=A0AAN7YB98_9PEZI|nr:hypothetical protein LTR62_001585 [Meristemomyces frigidus]